MDAVVEPKYPSEQCYKTFPEASQLKIHKIIHSGEKPLTCNQCSKSFSQVGHLKKHMRTHSGEKAFACKQCLKSFS